jgi:hypothetical protein
MILFIIIGVAVISAGMVTGIILPSLSGEHYDHYNLLNLTPEESTQALMISMNSSDTLFYNFQAPSYVAVWVVDPAGNQVVEPQVYIRSKYGSGFKFVAESSGTYQLVFSSDVPDYQQWNLVMVDVRTGITPAK